MNWLDVVPVVLVCLGWLIVPGLLACYAIGLRGIAAWAIAPTLSVAIVTTIAVIAGMVGIPWSVPLVLIGSLLVGALSGGGAFLLRRRFEVVRPADPRPVTLAAALGMLPAVALGAITVAWGMGNPDALSQTYDAVFHYSAVAFILDSGNASTLTLAAIGSQSVPSGFYPGAWHDFTSLAVLSTGTTIPVAANLVTAVAATVVWPLGCLVLVRQLVGRSVAAMAITATISIGFTAFPWGLMDFGVLWPNTLGLSLVPAGVAVAVSLSGLAKDDAIGRGRAWLLVPFVLIAGGFAHPNSLFSLVAIVLFPLFTGIGRWALRMRAEGRTRRGLLGLGIAVVVFLAGWRFVATTPALAVVRTFYWPPFESSSRALGEVLLGATNGRPSLWVLSLAVFVGVVLIWRERDQRWLIGAFAATGFMFVLTAAVNSPATQAITGYWYNDSFRVAAILPVVTVPLAVLGILAVAQRLQDRLGAVERLRQGWLGRSTVGLTLLVALLVVIGSKGLYLRTHVGTVGFNYVAQKESTTGNLVDSRERVFFAKVGKSVPEGTLVANNPWDGSALIWALGDRKPLFSHLATLWSDEQKYLAKHLVDAGTDAKVCEAAKRLKVGYLVIGNQHFWPGDARIADYPGITDPGAKPGFQLVESDRELKLYKITAC